jgi:hypothetical protein
MLKKTFTSTALLSRNSVSVNNFDDFKGLGKSVAKVFCFGWSFLNLFHIPTARKVWLSFFNLYRLWSQVNCSQTRMDSVIGEAHCSTPHGATPELASTQYNNKAHFYLIPCVPVNLHLHYRSLCAYMILLFCVFKTVFGMFAMPPVDTQCFFELWVSKFPCALPSTCPTVGK